MRHIGRDELEALKRGVDLVALVRSHGVELQKAGRVYRARCPFPGHDDKTPSFTVDPAKNTYRCYGACSRERQTGDAIAFLRHLQGLTFPQAIDVLFPGFGVRDGNGNGPKPMNPTPPTDPLPASAKSSSLSKEEEDGDVDVDVERSRLLDAVVRHYERTLATSTRAQRYLDKRALLVPEVLQTLRVGFSDGSLAKAVAAKGAKKKQLTDVGVLKNGRDVFTGKLVVPLCDPANGAVVSLYGRSVTGAVHVYLKGPLRGLVNGPVARSADHLVVVESVLDAVSLLVLGIDNVVPIYGTNGWTKDHDALLDDGTAKTVTLLLDNDDAGRNAAAARADELAGRGALKAVRIATLPEPHKDPNDALVAGVDGDGLRQVLDQARTVFEAKEHKSGPGTTPKNADDRRPLHRTDYQVEDLDDGFRLTVGPRRYWARAVRGGGYVNLHMTLRLEDGDGEHIDRLDLYNGRARRSFALRAARRFGFDDETIERELVLLTQLGELYVAEQADKADDASERPKPPELSDEEKAEALAFLKRPDLLDLTVDHLTRLGYVGELANKTLGYLIIVSRKLGDPLSALVLSQAAAGKSGLVELLERVTPPEDVEFFSRLTPAALYYMERDRLQRKIVIIEERPGSEEADYSIRTLQSRKKLVLGVPVRDPKTGRTETRTKEVDGPAVFLQTTTALEVNYENSTRCFELYLDESEEQTRRIHERQRRLSTLAGLREAAGADDLIRLHWNAQRLLRHLQVVIPYAEKLTFPETWLRTRRDQERFLNLIKASAFLHQYQRNSPNGVEPDTVVEAAVADYEVAYRLAADILGATLADLRKPARELLAEMKRLAVELGRDDGRAPDRVLLSRRQVREHTGLPDHQVRRLLHDLVELEHVEQVRGSRGALCLYRIPRDAGEPERVLNGLLTPAELTKRLRIGKART